MINRRKYRNYGVCSIAASALALSCAALAQRQDQPIREVGTPTIQINNASGITTLDHVRGALLYFDSFDRYPTSDDPVFERFQVSMQDRGNGSGGSWTAFNREYLNSLFVAGQVDDLGTIDPLPRWFGADLLESAGETLLGDLSGDLIVDTTDLGVLIGSFGQVGPDQPADLNNDGVVDTADLGIMLGVFGDTLGPFCLYEVSLVREIDPDGLILPQPVIDASPALSEIIAVPVSAGVCGLCSEYRFQALDQTMPVYGQWTLIDAETPVIDSADYIAQSISQVCDGWGSESTLTLARTESELNIPNCCFYSLFTALGRQSTATPTSDIVTQADLFLTGRQTFLWFQGIDNNIRTAWDVMIGGIPLWLDLNLLPFADENGELRCFIIRQSPQVPGAGQGLFFGTVPDAITGAIGKEALIGEWFTIKMVQHSNSTFEFWVRDSETILLEDVLPGSDADGISDDGFARLVPSGPYGPAIWNLQPGVPAPDPFLVATPRLRQLQWLWGGDPSPAEDPNYVPANWFMDNIRVRGPF